MELKLFPTYLRLCSLGKRLWWRLNQDFIHLRYICNGERNEGLVQGEIDSDTEISDFLVQDGRAEGCALISSCESTKIATSYRIIVDRRTLKRSEVKSLSHVQRFAIPWTVAYQAHPTMGFSRQECWSWLPFPSPGDLPDPGFKPGSPSLQADALTSEQLGKPQENTRTHQKKILHVQKQRKSHSEMVGGAQS